MYFCTVRIGFRIGPTTKIGKLKLVLPAITLISDPLPLKLKASLVTMNKMVNTISESLALLLLFLKLVVAPRSTTMVLLSFRCKYGELLRIIAEPALYVRFCSVAI